MATVQGPRRWFAGVTDSMRNLVAAIGTDTDKVTHTAFAYRPQLPQALYDDDR
jgi:hypothetical protein